MIHPLMQLTADLIDFPSESFNEAAIAHWLHAELTGIPGLEVVRVGDNIVARTNLGREHRVALGGHLDTVPENDNGKSRFEGEGLLYGLGASDMKGGIAIMIELARNITEPAVDVTYVFYAREEVAIEHNGLRLSLIHISEPTRPY